MVELKVDGKLSVWREIHLARLNVIYRIAIRRRSLLHVAGVKDDLILRSVAGAQGHTLRLELGHQAVQVVLSLPLKGGSGKVLLLQILQLPLDGDDGFQVTQSDGHPIHLGHLRQIGGRVIEPSLDLLQGVLHPVQNDDLVGDQLAVLVQKIQGIQQGIGLLIALAAEILHLGEDALVFRRVVVQQIAYGGQSRPGQHGQCQAKRQNQTQYDT